MIISAHQPAYLPWMGYFNKIIRSDIFIFLDTVQLEKNSFSARNKIKTIQGDLWMTLPIKMKGHTQMTIKDMQIDNSINWKKKHLKRLFYNYKKAPFFDDLYPKLEILYDQSFELFSDLAFEHLMFWLKELKIKTKVIKSSDLNINSNNSDLILDLCTNFNATKYISGSEGKRYLIENDFIDNKIEIEYQNYIHPVYRQINGEFHSHMAVADLIFNEGPLSKLFILSKDNNEKTNNRAQKAIKSNLEKNVANLFLEVPNDLTKSNNKSFIVSIVSDEKTWMLPWIQEFLSDLAFQGIQISWVTDPMKVIEGDFCFILSFSKIIPIEVLNRNKHNLVVHESGLPKGKGWSPLSWQILEGKKSIPVSLFEAEEKVDSGKIYLQELISLNGDELIHELREKQGSMTIDLCRKFLESYPLILDDAIKQSGENSFYRKRDPSDSMIDINKTILEQFNLFRIVDNERYPAYFDFLGKRFYIRIEKEE